MKRKLDFSNLKRNTSDNSNFLVLEVMLLKRFFLWRPIYRLSRIANFGYISKLVLSASFRNYVAITYKLLRGRGSDIPALPNFWCKSLVLICRKGVNSVRFEKLSELSCLFFHVKMWKRNYLGWFFLNVHAWKSKLACWQIFRKVVKHLTKYKNITLPIIIIAIFSKILPPLICAIF